MWDYKRQSIVFYFRTAYLVSTDGQRHSRVEVLPPVVHRLAVTKDLGFKVLDHVLHDFTEQPQENTGEKRNVKDGRTADPLRVCGGGRGGRQAHTG